MVIVEYYAGYLSQYLRGTRGVAAMEYAIITGVIVVGVGLAIGLFQDQITGLIQDVTTDLGTVRTNVATDSALPAASGG